MAMADFVSPMIDIISRLWPCCASHTRYALKELTDARNDVQRRVDENEADPNEPKKRKDQVDGWVQRVQITEGEVEEILKKADILNGRCFGGCCPPSNKCWGNYKLGKSIAEQIPLVDELKRNGHFEEVTYNLLPPPVQDMNLESTVGMESMFDKVWRLLITSTATVDDKVVRIMGLYGQGGVGKTTLLEKINNEFNNGSSEHVVIFAVVPKPINYEALQTQIGERLRLSLQGGERTRANEIFNVLRNNKFVILLDDIWERVDLRRIGIPLTQGNSSSSTSSSSKVIFTTHSIEVCGQMEATHAFRVECLPWDKAWRLFKDKVGEATLSSISRQGAGELAEVVAKECGGLPLALITIGRAMSTTKSAEEWKDAITTLRSSASEFEGMGDEVLPRLKLSYDNLRNDTIKSCFLYCALYPKNYSIEIAKLIDIWIAEGFLNGFNNNLDEARSHGFTVIETLKRACLLEESGENLENPEVKMHDVIRDLALWFVNECKSNSKTTGKFLIASKNVCERWRNAQRIFWMITKRSSSNNELKLELELELEKPPTSPNLRTLIVSFGNYFCLPQSFFHLMPSLRVLDLSNTLLSELSSSIGELSELQYLGLANTWIKELPVELKKLVKLKFLDLTYTTELSKISAGVIANLSELQVLKLTNSGLKDWESEEEKEDGGRLSLGELDRLKKLQELGITIHTSLALEKLLLCNQNIRMVCTDLHCENIKSIPSSSSISEGGLGLGLGLMNLKRLEYSFMSSSSAELEELTLIIINGAAATAASGLLKNMTNVYHHHHDHAFQNLDTIRIISCNDLKDLTWLVYVENLKTLNVWFCQGLETIIDLGDDDNGLEGTAGGGGGGGVFGRLEHLNIGQLPKLKSICRHALAFPSIETIRISFCPELKKLPLGSGSNVENTLKWIHGSSSWWNELEWEDETINSKFLPYFL